MPLNRNIMSDLNKLMTQLKSDFITDSGLINYAGMKESELFQKYTKLAGDLVDFDASQLNELDRKTFFINLYNCQTLHVLAMQGDLPKSPKVRKSFKYIRQLCERKLFTFKGHCWDVEQVCLQYRRSHSHPGRG